MRNVVQLFWLQILFCSCVNETTLAPACNHGRSLCQLRREQFGIFTRSKEQWKYEKGTKVAYNVFWEYLKWKKKWQSLISSKEKLVSVMRKFYAEVWKRNGELCTKSSLVRIRVGLQQFFSSHKIDIIKDPEFSGANAVYQAEISELKQKEKLTHYTNHQ